MPGTFDTYFLTIPEQKLKFGAENFAIRTQCFGHISTLETDFLSIYPWSLFIEPSFNLTFLLSD